MSEEIKREESARVERSEFAKPKKGGFKRHCARFWWIYLIIFLIIALLVILLIIFVAVPKIAQKKINEAKLNLDGIVVTQTQTNNFTMAINSTITTDGSQHATIAAFDGVMYLEDWAPQRPFATVHFPQTSSAKFQEVNVTQFTPITDLEAFTVFNTWLLVNETLRVTVKGDTHVRVKGLSRNYGVSFKKTITMPGLSNFNGTTVPESTIALQADDNGDNFKGTVTIPNKSLVTFEIGNASFHNYLLGAEIGTVYIDNIILSPGLNNFSMHANISQLPVLNAIAEKPYCQSGILPFQLRGKEVFNHGQPLSYYADALASSNQTVDIDIGADLEKDLSYTVKCSS
ncbi:hypothetical protein UCRPA7_8004 [Phaeoacremonium minimum UCRPA7]|uniref:Uncharacterized protein n=1 Tax=Phaeoacremonium minimum (strain UCR-PA7) TaxID=1286976 RepID=R8BAZ7_PHAM7|nr:hypothetical protein UCRPA7_8004 [Phaeoacremonium minimum UCRPA7]EON96508.1 hypothetical protein UCRPA7_8004 [Phaeoacremonium minimum UCRPA7]